MQRSSITVVYTYGTLRAGVLASLENESILEDVIPPDAYQCSFDRREGCSFTLFTEMVDIDRFFDSVAEMIRKRLPGHQCLVTWRDIEKELRAKLAA